MFFIQAFSRIYLKNKAGSESISNTTSLKQWINNEGLVDYKAIKEESWLQIQIKNLRTADLSIYSTNEELAFWLNAYNLLTLKGVLIELKKNPNWKGNISYFSKIKFFYLRRFEVAGRKINLYNLENKILRKKFQDPRIHFAINCASKSCPTLPGSLFRSENLDEYLTELTYSFINDPNHVYYDSTTRTLHLNPIFEWYRKDFDINGGTLAFISKYLETTKELPKNPTLKFLKYDWRINSQPNSKNNLFLDI